MSYRNLDWLGEIETNTATGASRSANGPDGLHDAQNALALLGLTEQLRHE